MSLLCTCALSSVFFFNDTATTEIYTLSLHDALPISSAEAALDVAQRYSGPIHVLLTDVIMPGLSGRDLAARLAAHVDGTRVARSEEHTSELQSQSNLVCRLLLEKKNTTTHTARIQRH